ncbi:uncharacterized protein LOC144023447 isoform X2 [Festucalex cinctus]
MMALQSESPTWKCTPGSEDYSADAKGWCQSLRLIGKQSLVYLWTPSSLHKETHNTGSIRQSIDGDGRTSLCGLIALEPFCAFWAFYPKLLFRGSSSCVKRRFRTSLYSSLDLQSVTAASLPRFFEKQRQRSKATIKLGPETRLSRNTHTPDDFDHIKSKRRSVSAIVEEAGERLCLEAFQAL